MEKTEIITQLQSIANNDDLELTDEQKNAIQSACTIIKNATTREQWLSALQKLGPLLVDLGAKFFQ